VTTITDFLLARIADDIALAREVQAQGVTDGLATDDPRSAPLRLASRTLALCAAHRVAVQWYLNDDDTVMAPTIEALAAAYADHPDYDEAWRP
jgi:hypothetical protein